MPATQTNERKSRLTFGLRVGGLFALLVLAVLLALRIDPREIVAWIRAQGAWGPIWLAVLYVPACVFLLPGSALTLAGGFLFGLWPAYVAVTVGSLAGATLSFNLGRSLLRGWVERAVAARPQFAALDRAVEAHGFRVVLLTRLSPLLPFNLLNYAFGLTRVGLRDYVVGSWIGMIPGTLAFCYLGAAAQSLEAANSAAGSSPLARWWFWIGLAATLASAAYLTRLAATALQASLAVPREPPSPANPS